MKNPEKNEDEIRVERDRTTGGYRLESALFLPAQRDEIFAFFSDAFQLENLTPPWLSFHVVTPAPINIAAGTLIDYQLRIRGISIRWQSRITIWEPPLRFVDEQVRGPYRRWHHEHRFEDAPGGTICRDIVRYAVPGGALVHALFVGPDVRRIFRYRCTKLRERFGSTRVM